MFLFDFFYVLPAMVNKDDYYKNMLLRQFTKSHKYSVPIDNVQLAKRQTKQMTF